MVELVPSLLRQELARLAEESERIDGRGQWDTREVSLETNCLYNAEGSAKVVMGGTVVYAGVKFELRTRGPTAQPKVRSCAVLNFAPSLAGNTNPAPFARIH